MIGSHGAGQHGRGGRGGQGTGGNRGGTSGRGGGAGQATNANASTKKKRGGDSRKRSHTHDIPALYNGGGSSIRSSGTRGGGSRPSAGGRGGTTIVIADDISPEACHSLRNPPSNAVSSQILGAHIPIELDEDTNADKLDHFSHKLQMVQLMNKNSSSKNPESFTTETTYHMLQSVLDKEQHILETVHAEKPHLIEEMTDALHADFVLGPNKRLGKYHYCKKMVKIWYMFRQIDSLKDPELQGGTRNSSLKSYVQMMVKFDKRAKEVVDDHLNKAKVVMSDKMPPGEIDHQYLQGGGTSLNALEFPFCPNPKCRHTLIDQPPGNADVASKNAQANYDYLQLCKEVRTWKRGEGVQPVCPDTGIPLKKPPKVPTKLKKYLRCHCHQNGVNMRTGKTCAVKCIFKGQQYNSGECPLCKCVCHAFIPLDSYRSIMIATSMGPVKQDNDRAGARKWLLDGTNVNLMQQEVLSQMYDEMASNGSMQRNASYFTNIGNEGALAQANHMLANKPSDAHRRELQRMIDKVQHPAGPSFTIIGDMNTFGRASRADKRVTNNHLELALFAPQDMSDEEMLQQGIAQSNLVVGGQAGGRASSAYAPNLDFDALHYAPANMSEDEMIQHALRESTSTGAADHARGGTFCNVDGGSMAASNNIAEDDRKMPATSIEYANKVNPSYLRNITGPLLPLLLSHSSAPSSNLHYSISKSFSTSTAFTPNENGILDSVEKPTPVVVQTTRDSLIQRRSTCRQDWSQDQREASAYAVDALSRPHVARYVNCVNANANKSTPERVDQVLLFGG